MSTTQRSMKYEFPSGITDKELLGQAYNEAWIVTWQRRATQWGGGWWIYSKISIDWHTKFGMSYGQYRYVVRAGEVVRFLEKLMEKVGGEK